MKHTPNLNLGVTAFASSTAESATSQSFVLIRCKGFFLNHWHFKFGGNILRTYDHLKNTIDKSVM